MAKAADCVALTSLHAALFRFMEVIMTGRNDPSSNGPNFKVIPSVMMPWVTSPPTTHPTYGTSKISSEKKKT